MTQRSWNLVTGATGYTGKYITRQLLASGERVKTWTGHLGRANPFGNQVLVLPYCFNDHDAMVTVLQDVDVLYNTYWVRFEHGGMTYQRAIDNTRALLRAARDAGVRKIVHVSIANPDEWSPLPYYRGKAVLEQAVRSSGLQCAIIRPTVIFGDEDILINNIAWCLRHLPVFGVPGSGEYRIQPMFVEDMAALCVEAAREQIDRTCDAVGPEIFTFRELARMLAASIGSRSRIVRMPPTVAFWCSRLIGRIIGDEILTREELRGLMDDLLVSRQAPTGRTQLSVWAVDHAQTLGRRYASEVARHFAAR